MLRIIFILMCVCVMGKGSQSQADADSIEYYIFQSIAHVLFKSLYVI